MQNAASSSRFAELIDTISVKAPLVLHSEPSLCGCCEAGNTRTYYEFLVCHECVVCVGFLFQLFQLGPVLLARSHIF